MTNDYPDVELHRRADCPPGPAGKGTLAVHPVLGHRRRESKAQEQAVDLVDFLTTDEQQLAFADAFGVMPSRQSASGDFASKYPDDKAFIDGGDYGHGPITAPGMDQVIADLNSQLEDFKGADLASVSKSFDTNADAALGQ